MDKGLPRRRRLRWSLMTATYVCACTHWQVQSVSPQQVLETRKPQKIRVTRTDRTEVVLSQPTIVSDTLYGISAGSPRGTNQPLGEGIALADVSRVAIRRVDPVRTTALVVGSAVVVAGAIVAIAVSSVASE
jgi:hypothetical protein